MKKVIFALFVGLNACGQPEKEFEIEFVVTTTDVVEVVKAPEELTSETLEEEYVYEDINVFQWMIDAALEVSGTVHPDNVECETLLKEVQVTACKYSNDSYQRVLGYSAFTSEQSIVFISKENWDTFLAAIDFDVELYGKPGAFCSYSDDTTQSVMFLSYEEDAKELTSYLNHERIHCSFDVSHDEVMSQFMEYLLTTDQAMMLNDQVWATGRRYAYEYIYNVDTIHSQGRMVMGDYLKQITEAEGSYENYFSPVALNNLMLTDYSTDEVFADIELTDYVVDFVKAYFKHQKDAGVYP